MSAINDVKHDSYEPAKLNVLHQVIQNAHTNGQKQDYEILVDDFKVIPRTSNPDLFNSFSDFITADSKIIMVKMFRGGSNQQDKYYFHIKGAPQKEQTINGIENTHAEELEAKQKAKLLKEIRYEELESENAELLEEVEKQENIIAELQQKYDDLKEGKLLTFTEMGTSFLSGVLRHPAVKDFSLGGFGKSAKPEENTKKEQEDGATFSRKEEKAEDYIEGLSDDERGYLLLVRDLEERFEKHELSIVMHILDLLSQYPKAIGPVQKTLTSFINCRRTKEETNEKV